MSAYDAALSLSPPSGPARALVHANRAACLLRDGRLSECVRECGAALTASPGFERALLRRARAYELAGHLAEAEKDLEGPARARGGGCV